MAKKKKKKNRYSRHGDIMESKPVVFTMAILGILIGIFFIVSQNDNKPISRSEAVAYSGTFEKYDITGKNHREICLQDGTSYWVYPHTETQAFRTKMNSLEKGTKLYILVNPNNDYVAEIKTDTEELLNFEISQKEIDSYDNGYIILGIVACLAGVFLIIYEIASICYKRKEAIRRREKRNNRVAQTTDKSLRAADLSVKSRILLEARADNYQICYRRVKSVNELVINNLVYDERKGLIEFEHKLFAVIDGHTIEAGYDQDGYSYIRFDRTRIAEKKRFI